MELVKDEGLYVVRRAFKAHGNLYLVGQVIEDPTSIKLFRSRLSERYVVKFSPDTVVQNKIWMNYMETRLGVELDQRILDMCEEKEEPIQEDEKLKQDTGLPSATEGDNTPPVKDEDWEG